eukprot:scaffold167824_cov25-Tisochrysis_lutea.AAC.1
MNSPQERPTLCTAEFVVLSAGGGKLLCCGALCDLREADEEGFLDHVAAFVAAAAAAAVNHAAAEALVLAAAAAALDEPPAMSPCDAPPCPAA